MNQFGVETIFDGIQP